MTWGIWGNCPSVTPEKDQGPISWLCLLLFANIFAYIPGVCFTGLISKCRIQWLAEPWHWTLRSACIQHWSVLNVYDGYESTQMNTDIVHYIHMYVVQASASLLRIVLENTVRTSQTEHKTDLNLFLQQIKHQRWAVRHQCSDETKY